MPARRPAAAIPAARATSTRTRCNTPLGRRLPQVRLVQHRRIGSPREAYRTMAKALHGGRATDRVQHLRVGHQQALVVGERRSATCGGPRATSRTAGTAPSATASGSSSGIMQILDKQDDLRKHAGPGHWNDPDMMEVGNMPAVGEDRAHFAHVGHAGRAAHRGQRRPQDERRHARDPDEQGSDRRRSGSARDLGVRPPQGGRRRDLDQAARRATRGRLPC